MNRVELVSKSHVGQIHIATDRLQQVTLHHLYTAQREIECMVSRGRRSQISHLRLHSADLAMIGSATRALAMTDRDSHVMKRRTRSAVRARGSDRIEFTIHYRGKLLRPTLAIKPTEANLRRAQQRMQEMIARIDAGTFDLLEEFPDYRIQNRDVHLQPIRPRTCNDVFDKFLTYAEHRVAMNDMAFSTYNTYRKIINRTWRPQIGNRSFLEITHTELLEIPMSQGGAPRRPITMA